MIDLVLGFMKNTAGYMEAREKNWPAKEAKKIIEETEELKREIDEEFKKYENYVLWANNGGSEEFKDEQPNMARVDSNRRDIRVLSRRFLALGHGDDSSI